MALKESSGPARKPKLGINVKIRRRLFVIFVRSAVVLDAAASCNACTQQTQLLQSDDKCLGRAVVRSKIAD